MRVLIATGGSDHSDIAVRFGAQLAIDANLELTILTVIKHESDQSQAATVLAHAISLTGMDSSKVHTHIRIGNPAKEIIREAGDGQYDLIIIGARATHKLLSRQLGTTTEWVVSHAPCPVIIAKECPTSIQRILLCISGAKPLSPHTLFTAKAIAHLGGQFELTVLHVMSQMSAGPGAVAEWQLRANADELIREQSPEGEWLQRDMDVLAQTDIVIQPRIRHGMVVDEILNEAQEGDYDLIVIGAHQNRGWQRFLLDNLAHQIVVKADRPVLVV